MKVPDTTIADLAFIMGANTALEVMAVVYRGPRSREMALPC